MKLATRFWRNIPMICDLSSTILKFKVVHKLPEILCCYLNENFRIQDFLYRRKKSRKPVILLAGSSNESDYVNNTQFFSNVRIKIPNLS